MPVRRKREPAVVFTPYRSGGSELLAYGFQSGGDAGTMADLGQVLLEVIPSGSRTVVFGANSPKPARMSKIDAAGFNTESGYCDYSKISTARAADWRMVRGPKYAGDQISFKMIGVYVETSGRKAGATPINYGWMMDKLDFILFGAELGISEVTPTTEVVYGAQSPKPANLAKRFGARMSGSFVSDSQYATAKADGWVERRQAKPPID